MSGRRRTVYYSLLAALALAALAALCPAGAPAQCPMCRAGLEHGGEATRSLNYGILVLLVPPVAIFCSIFAVAYKKVKGEDENGEW